MTTLIIILIILFVITWIVIKSNKSEKVDVGDGIPSCMIQAYNRAYEDVIRASRADAMKGLSMDPLVINWKNVSDVLNKTLETTRLNSQPEKIDCLLIDKKGFERKYENCSFVGYPDIMYIPVYPEFKVQSVDIKKIPKKQEDRMPIQKHICFEFERKDGNVYIYRER